MSDTKFSNIHNIDLSLAVWLLAEGYDFVPGDFSISATSLLKPTRQLILMKRMMESDRDTPDLSDRISLRLGHAIHDSVERAWKEDYARAFRLMGMHKYIDQIVINPEPGTDLTGKIPVYIEVRSQRTIGKWTVSGKLDFALNGRLKDIKSTSVWTYVKGRKDEDYIRQGSIYKWLNPDKITHDEIDIQFVFMDHQKSMMSIPNYPAIKLKSYSLPLLDEQSTEKFITEKLTEVEKYLNEPEEKLPFCTDEELWRSQAYYKYYSNPEKKTRATRSFEDEAEAREFMTTVTKGELVTIPGKVKACGYCPVFNICKQKDLYEHD